MGTSLAPDPVKPSIEAVLAQQANDAISKGADPASVSSRLGQMVTHLRANPELAAHGSDALASGADPGQVAARILKLSDSGNIDLREGAKPTPAPKAQTISTTSPNSAEGIADSGLDTFSFGLHRRGLGVTQAVIDALEHGTNSHPIDTYNNSVNATLVREKAASAEHPTSTSAANATGFFGSLAAASPLRAMLGLGEAAPAAATAGRRILESAKTGGATGAVVGGLSSEGSGEHRAVDASIGGLLGSIFGGGGQAVAETGGKIGDVLRQITTSPEEAGSKAADFHIVKRLNADDLEPRDLLQRAKDATAMGSPAVVAHLGGPSLDPLTYLGAQGASRDAGILRTALNEGQRAEGSLLNRGITEMSGIPNAPERDASVFASKLDEVRSAKAASDYPKAYAAKPVNDSRILDIIRNDPDLSDALSEGVKIMQREQDVARINGKLGRPVVNPLDAAASQEPTLSPEGEALKRLYPNTDIDALIRKGFGTPGGDGQTSIPVQMLDYMKRGAQEVIDKGTRKGNLSEYSATLLKQKVEAILQAVDKQVPEYATARGNYANTSGQIEAASAGKKAFKNSGAAIADELSQLEPDAAKAHRTGFTSELRGDIAGRPNDSNISRRFDNPATRAQLSAEYGPQGVEKFDPYLEQGRTLNRVREAASGNSQTAPRAQARQEVLGSSSADAIDVPSSPKHAVLRLLNARDARRKDAILQALAQRLNVPANSPELPALVDHLYKAIQPPTAEAVRSNLGKEVFRGATSAVRGPTARGILAGLFAGGQ